MNILGISINGNFIKQFLIGIFCGWLVGLLINWINIFGSSEKAPLICAMAVGIFTFRRLVNEQKRKV